MESLHTEKSSKPFVSVVIPVYNDSKHLKLCLDALENQTYPQKFYEVIVVDNGSHEAQKVKEVVEQYDQALIIYENYPGSYAARNKGIAIAKGSIIAFTDADCIPAIDWIEKGVANLVCLPKCGLVAGKVEFFFQNSTQKTSVEFYDSLTSIPQKYFLEEKKFGATANLFSFKHVFDNIGYFKDALKSGGDMEWGNRVFLAGYQQIYADDTCVAHPARYSYSQLYKRVKRITGGKYDLQKKGDDFYAAFFKDLIAELMPPLKTTFRILFGKNIYSWTDQKADKILQKLT